MWQLPQSLNCSTDPGSISVRRLALVAQSRTERDLSGRCRFEPCRVHQSPKPPPRGSGPMCRQNSETLVVLYEPQFIVADAIRQGLLEEIKLDQPAADLGGIHLIYPPDRSPPEGPGHDRFPDSRHSLRDRRGALIDAAADCAIVLHAVSTVCPKPMRLAAAVRPRPDGDPRAREAQGCNPARAWWRQAPFRYPRAS